MHHSRIQQLLLVCILFAYSTIAASGEPQYTVSLGCPAPAMVLCTCQTPVEDACDSGPCLNGGICSSEDGAFTCQCSEGYTGRRCGRPEVDACESGPCQNGGGCISEDGGFTCQCSEAYTGDTCETQVDACKSSPCQNGGTCISDGGFTCQCSEAYTGERCETVVSCEFFVTSRTGEGKFLSGNGEITKNVSLLSDVAIQVSNDGTGKLFYTTAEGNSVYLYDMSAYPVVKEAKIAVFDGDSFGIAVDPEFEVIFVGLRGIGIQSVNYQGEERTTVANLQNLDFNGLALDADTQDLFFADSAGYRVRKVNYQDLNNTGEAITIKSGFPSQPRSLATDKPAQQLYILLHNGAIWSLNLLNHTLIGQIVSAPNEPTSTLELSVCGENFYYTTWVTNTIWKISKSEPDGNKREKFNLAPVGQLRGITTI